MKERTIGWIVVVVLVIGGIYLFTLSQQKSNAEKYVECRRNAGELHDSLRQKITKNANGYSKEEQAYYYQQTENGYISDLNGCRELYRQ